MESKEVNKISFVTHPGVVLDRILTIFAKNGRNVAMTALAEAVKADVREQGHGGRHTPLTLLWYVVGARVSGDASFHLQPAFVSKLAFSEHETALYRLHTTAIETFRSTTSESA
ncbi:hypothetical protein WT25_02600 [Burkholderia territorii]|uniref:hypothetical protein n=1 Tax=Burkholderia territorii TaxID=1503055 RepID=UPI0007578329|nr:hypothetical protein [Burkholderia territorii]KVT75794.1 hypothetical protein WT25_02600 [Burkholderia territorii]